jgi:hypothetical protein
MVTFLTENLSIRCLAILLLVYSLIFCVQSPSPNFGPSSRYLSTGNWFFTLGLFTIASGSVSALYSKYTIPMSNHTLSGNSYDVALNFGDLHLIFDNTRLAL